MPCSIPCAATPGSTACSASTEGECLLGTLRASMIHSVRGSYQEVDPMATIAPAQAQRVVIATAHPRRPSRPRGVRLWLDQLESRVLLSAGDSIANAVGLSFLNTSAIYQTAHATEYLADPRDVQL